MNTSSNYYYFMKETLNRSMGAKLGMLTCCLFLLGAVNQCSRDVTDPKLAALVKEIDVEWRKGYQVVLDDIGTRHFSVDRSQAMTSMRKILENMGFKVINAEANYYLYVSGSADTPFSDEEWRRGRQEDEPLMKEIAGKYLGWKGKLAASLDPEGLEIHGTVTFIESNNGVDITITFRLIEIKPQPPESIIPRREYPPPGTVRIAYEKIWRLFEEQTLPLARMAGE